jgi:MSHA biogenesis protein MshN
MDLFPMSLINKMLQDLDARRSDVAGGSAYGPQIRPVPARPRFHVAWWVAIALGVGLIAVFAWEMLRPPIAGRTDMHSPIKSEKKVQANAGAAPASATGGRIEAAPAAGGQSSVPRATPVSPAAPASVADKSILAVPPPVLAAAEDNSPLILSHSLATRPAAAADNPASDATQARKKAVADKVALVPKSTPKAYIPDLPKTASAGKPPAAAPYVPSASPVAPLGLNKQIKELTPQQRSDNEYRKALSLIQQGMSTEAMNGLEQALQLDPQHAAARQTLIGQLLENKRQDEALRIARAGLSMDLAQPGLAMIAARLQLEKGGLRPAIETLEKTLPNAADREDYQSFLAALLQRDGRHKEAVEHYLIALQKAPQNGVWWMGLGISFQGDHRPAEAQEAFSKAKATNTLSPELLAFVESKLRQLQR